MWSDSLVGKTHFMSILPDSPYSWKNSSPLNRSNAQRCEKSHVRFGTWGAHGVLYEWNEWHPSILTSARPRSWVSGSFVYFFFENYSGTKNRPSPHFPPKTQTFSSGSGVPHRCTWAIPFFTRPPSSYMHTAKIAGGVLFGGQKFSCKFSKIPKKSAKNRKKIGKIPKKSGKIAVFPWFLP